MEVVCTLYLFMRIARCSPPGDVVKCGKKLTGPTSAANCSVSNAYGMFPDRTTCTAAEVVYPTTEEEVMAAVAKASERNQRMRVVTRYSYSIPKLVCPSGQHGLIISTRDLNHAIAVDKSSMRMTVESGVALKDAIDVAAVSGLALPHSPYWLGLTIGGLLSTGAHGSSLFGKGSAVHEYMAGMRLVVPATQHEGYAKIVILAEDDEDLNAAKVSLGLLGVISQVTLQLQPMFKRSITNVEKNDTEMENNTVRFGMDREFADLTWYPSQHKVVYRIDDRVPANSSGDGVNNFFGFRPHLTALVRNLRRREEAQEAAENADGKCRSAKLQISTLLKTGTGFKNNDLLFEKYPVIGYQNKLQASGLATEDALLSSCAWDPRIRGEFFHQTTATIGLSQIKEFLSDVKKLRDMNPSSLCGVDLYSGFLMRYVKASSAYLGKQEDSIDIDITIRAALDCMKTCRRRLNRWRFSSTAAFLTGERIATSHLKAS